MEQDEHSSYTKCAVYCDGCESQLPMSSELEKQYMLNPYFDESTVFIHNSVFVQNVMSKQSRLVKVLYRRFRYLGTCESGGREIDAGLCTSCHGNLTRQPHLTVLTTMLREKSLNIPTIGDRVPYVVEFDHGRGGKMYKRTVHPDSCIQLDMLYAFDVLQNALMHIIPHLGLDFDKAWFNKMRKRIERRHVSRTRSIACYFTGHKRSYDSLE